jgi:O-antigen/teichoic acid export membrane protein
VGEPSPPDGRGTSGLGLIRHLAKQSALLVSSGLFSYVAAFALNVLLARTLGAEPFGVWVVAYSIAQTLAALGLVGSDWIVLRQGSYYHGIGDRPRLRRTVHLALALAGTALVVLGAILIALAPLLGQAVFHSASIVPMLRLAGVMGPVIGIGQIMLFGTQAFKDMRDVALIRNVVAPLTRLVFVAVALLATSSQLSAFIGVFAAELAIAGMAVRALHRRLPLFGPTGAIETGPLIRFALPVWGKRLSEVTRSQLFPIFLGSLASLEDSAVFAAGKRVALAPAAVINSMNQVFSPMGSDLFLRGRRDELIALFKSVAKWGFLLGFPLFCLEVTFPGDILAMFGKDFTSGDTALIVLAVGMLFQFGTGPVTVTLIVIGRPRLALLDYIIVILAEIGLAIWLIPGHGVLGAAIASMVGNMLNNVLPLGQIWHLLHFHPYRVDYWKPVAAGVVSVALARWITSVVGVHPGVPTAVVASATIGVCYPILILLLGLSAQDKAAVQALIGMVSRSGKSPEAPDDPAVDGEDVGA